MDNLKNPVKIIIIPKEDKITQLAADYFGISTDKVEPRHRKLIKVILQSGWEEKEIT